MEVEKYISLGEMLHLGFHMTYSYGFLQKLIKIRFDQGRPPDDHGCKHEVKKARKTTAQVLHMMRWGEP